MKLIKHIALTALTLSVGASTSFAQNLVWSSTFEDLTGWILSVDAGEQITVSNQRLLLSGEHGAYNPLNPHETHLAALHPIPLSGGLVDQRTLEFRVDWLSPHQNDAFAGIHAVWYKSPAQGYGFFVDEDEVALVKYWNDVTSFAVFFYDKPSISRANLTLVLALTRDGSDVNITTRVLDTDDGNTVLFERTVTDTPASDLVLADGSFRGFRSEDDPEGEAWPILNAPTEVDLSLQWVGSEPASVQVVYDNVEVWEYQSPKLSIQNAVVLSWAVGSTGFILECASNANGPWEAVPDPLTRTTADAVQVSVPASAACMFYRLRFDP